jgi:hypothetical protein
VAFGGPHVGLRFASAGYDPRGSAIVPQFMTGTPIVLAAAAVLDHVTSATIGEAVERVGLERRQPYQARFRAARVKLPVMV